MQDLFRLHRLAVLSCGGLVGESKKADIPRYVFFDMLDVWQKSAIEKTPPLHQEVEFFTELFLFDTALSVDSLGASSSA